MQGDRLCEKCGQLIPRGTTDCPLCSNPLVFNMRRESIILVCFLLTGVLFGITGIAVTQFHARERALGRQWYARGQAKLSQGDAAGAIPDIRTALFHVPRNPDYQLRLAQALVASGHEDEAHAYLLRLWESNPASGSVNLVLAQWAMTAGDVPKVINYYHNAIDGVWPAGSTVRRRNLRQALCQYLIHNHRHTEALAELMALASETPDDPQLLTQVGGLFLKVQDYDSALKEYLRSLGLNRRQPAAWAGAGKAAFRMGNYDAARTYLTRALYENPRDTASAHMLGTADEVLQINPFDRRVPVRIRRRRAIFAFERALARLRACARSRGEKLQSPEPQTDLQKLYASAMSMKPMMREFLLRHDPDVMDSGMKLVFQIEQASASACGAPKGLDLALMLIGQRTGGAD